MEGDTGLFLAAGLTAAEEREREEGERAMASFSSVLSRQLRVIQEATVTLGLILRDLQSWAGRSCCSLGPCNFDVEIRQAPGRGMTKGCTAGCRTSCPIESGKGGDGEGKMLENRFLRCQAVDGH